MTDALQDIQARSGKEIEIMIKSKSKIRSRKEGQKQVKDIMPLVACNKIDKRRNASATAGKGRAGSPLPAAARTECAPYQP